MSDYISSLAELLDPLSPEAFRAEYLHKRPLHVRGRADKFASTLAWADLNRMLAMDVWTQQTLQLNMDTNVFNTITGTGVFQSYASLDATQTARLESTSGAACKRLVWMPDSPAPTETAAWD